MSTKGIAAAINRDLLADTAEARALSECFACGRTYTPRQSRDDDDNTRFCGKHCQDGYDNGLPPYDPFYTSKNNQRWYSLPLGKHGFLVPCQGCGKTFDSKGLRCCSIQCERSIGERKEIARLKEEAGIDYESKMGPKAQCQECGQDIPRWRKGRKVPKNTRFCGDNCAAKARRVAK